MASAPATGAPGRRHHQFQRLVPATPDTHRHEVGIRGEDPPNGQTFSHRSDRGVHQPQLQRSELPIDLVCSREILGRDRLEKIGALYEVADHSPHLGPAPSEMVVHLRKHQARNVQRRGRFQGAGVFRFSSQREQPTARVQDERPTHWSGSPTCSRTISLRSSGESFNQPTRGRGRLRYAAVTVRMPLRIRSDCETPARLLASRKARSSSGSNTTVVRRRAIPAI